MSAPLAGPELVEKALRIALDAFSGEVDRTGRLKVLHSLRVGLRENTPEGQAAGFLHDVLEDTPIDAAALREGGIPDDVVAAVETVTRGWGEMYRSFIERISGGSVLAICTKLADLEDNLGRVHALPDDERIGLSRRYERAQERLRAELDQRAGEGRL